MPAMTSQARSVLVVDDEPAMRAALVANFRREGWDVETAGGVSEAMRKFTLRRFPVVVTDVRMPDGDGLHVMREVRRTDASTAVILLTAYGSVPEAVLAMQGGASDYLVKPCSFEQLKGAIAKVTGRAGPMPNRADGVRTRMVGESAALLRAVDRALAASRSDADILIEAESGTGKELLARLVHEHSGRRTRPFVAVNCAAVPEPLLETELFGHSRGAFTGAVNAKPGKFELAGSGTLLLDEIGEMPLALQPKLLRVLQEREFERVGETKPVAFQARIVATTNVSLLALVEAGRFRADLYFRLNVIPLTLPPLRERRGDISLLAEHFAAQISGTSGIPLPRLSASFLSRLQEHHWPGNVRELSNFMRRVLAIYPGQELAASCVDELLCAPPLTNLRRDVTSSSWPAPGTAIRTLERQLLESTLAENDGNRTRTAEMLGLSVRTIRNKIREYGLPPRRYA